jgi:hypothetical protein
MGLDNLYHKQREKGVWEGPVLSEGMGCTLKTSPDLPEHYYLFDDIYSLPFFEITPNGATKYESQIE